MHRFALSCFFVAALHAAPQAKIDLNKLPAAVQRTIQDETKGAEIKNIHKETEHGVVQYEVETMRDGKHRDFEVDRTGSLLAVEEETSIDSIPAAAQAAILKRVGDGKLGMVEVVKKGGVTMYEAAYTAKNGKKHEFLVKADGTPTKD